VFRRCGETWALQYDGMTVYMGHRRGLEYIAELLSHPGRPVAANSLQSAAAGAGSRSACRAAAGDFAGRDGLAAEGSHGSGGDELVTDGAALKQCEARLHDLDEEIEQAEADNDEGLASRLGEEREALVAYLRSGVGLRGRLRRVAGKRERARKAVSNAISRAIEAISKHHEVLGRHLRNAIRKGYEVVYDPETPTDWDL